MLAPEDAVAAAAAYRVEVPVLGFVDLLAEAGVGGVLAAGASITAPTAGSTSAEVERLPGPGAARRGMVVKAAGLRGARDFDSRLAGNPRPFQSVRAAGLGGLPC